jgi:uncharacterized protein
MGIFYYKLRNINTYLKNLNRVSFVAFLTLVLFFIALCFNYFIGFIKDKDIVLVIFPSKENNFGVQLISTVLLAPVIETFLCQALPYFLLNKVQFFHQRNCIILFTSALFFGILHFYSVFYIIYGFVLGLVLMFGYMIRIKNDKKAFLLIVICHTFLNLGILIINLN